MPELPEVEVTRLGLLPHLKDQTIVDMTIHESRFRWPMPEEIKTILLNQTLKNITRRSKYLLFEFSSGVMIIHLGMSGSLRIEQSQVIYKKHDHVEWHFNNGFYLRFHDPRRFGAVLWCEHKTTDILSHPLFAKLGLEPFDESFTAEYFYKQTRQKQVDIKSILLAGQIVVGAGNIYASESLFRAGIHPKTPAKRIGLNRYKRLVNEMKATLGESIAAGGSTLRDYTGARGETGYFQINTFVYDRAGEPCKRCQTPIKKIIQGQRSTFFCPQCQRY